MKSEYYWELLELLANDADRGSVVYVGVSIWIALLEDVPPILDDKGMSEVLILWLFGNSIIAAARGGSDIRDWNVRPREVLYHDNCPPFEHRKVELNG
jgi:hypothetical protein